MSILIVSDEQFKNAGVSSELMNKDVYDTILLYDKSCQESINKIEAEIKVLKKKGFEIGISLKIESNAF
jgi:hypothetical protein